jgi:hypothetical protein
MHGEENHLNKPEFGTFVIKTLFAVRSSRDQNLHSKTSVITKNSSGWITVARRLQTATIVGSASPFVRAHETTQTKGIIGVAELLK